MDLKNHYKTLLNIPFLQYLTKEELSRFLEEGSILSLNKGDLVFEDGDVGDTMYIILSGCIEIYKENKQIALRIASDYFGEMAMLDRKPRSASARAYTDCSLFKIDRNQFKNFLEDKPVIVKEFLATISERCRKDLEIIDAGFLALFQSEERYRTIIETISDIVLQLDPFGNIVFVNSAIKHLGYNPEELIGSPVRNILAEGVDDEANKLLSTRRVGPRATSNLEINFAVEKDSPLSEFTSEVTYLVDSHGIWNVKNNLVIKKGEDKIFLGTLCIARDITHRKQIEEDLKKQKDKLESLVQQRTRHLEEMITVAKKANQAKSDFLSRMNHELRTPLNSILGFSQLLLTIPNSNLDEQQTRSISLINEAGTHLLSMISDLMDLSEIESGHTKINVSDIELAHYCGPLVQLLEHEAADKQVAIENGIVESDKLAVKADKLRMKQVILNLLTNAIKYNRPNGTVRISAKEISQNRIQIKVEDTGIGIPEEKQWRVFEPFDRLERDLTGIEGTGIGLNIAKTLAEQMNGTLWFESVPDQGSTFYFELPKGQAQAEQKKGKGESYDLQPDDHTRSNFQILMVDDNLHSIQLIEACLPLLKSVELITAQNGKTGVAMAQSIQPNLILMDINMPEMSGLEALSMLKKDEKTRSIPVVALSALSTQNDYKKGLECGFDDYLTKPLNIQRFISLINARRKHSSPPNS